MGGETDREAISSEIVACDATKAVCVERKCGGFKEIEIFKNKNVVQRVYDMSYVW